jgi:hypothetical protein
MLSIDLSPPNSTSPEVEREVVTKEVRYVDRVDGVGAMRAGGAQDQGSCWLPLHVEEYRRAHREVRAS